jgi:hypothetical protein
MGNSPLIFAIIFAEDAKIVLDFLTDGPGEVRLRLRRSVGGNSTDSGVKQAAGSTKPMNSRLLGECMSQLKYIGAEASGT